MITTKAHSRLDYAGIALSALCLVHCLAVPIIASGALAWVASENIHIGLTVVLLGVVIAVAMPGYRKHRKHVVPALLGAGISLLIVAVVAGEAVGELGETGLTALGSTVLVLGHVLNIHYSACSCKVCDPEGTADVTRSENA